MLEKVMNYEFDKSELENKIQELERKTYKIDMDYNLIRKYKSEITEYQILKHLNGNEKIMSIDYIRDYTKEHKQGKLTREQFKENTLNCIGVDLLVETSDAWTRVDMKVLDYYPKYNKTGKIYNGKIDNDYGVENFVFQIEGKVGTLGWANNRYKQTDMLIVYIPRVKTIYRFNYKRLVDYINNKIYDKSITEKDYIVFQKGYGAYATREVVVSLSMKDIPKDVIIDIHKLD